jgi:hypothetical protein
MRSAAACCHVYKTLMATSNSSKIKFVNSVVFYGVIKAFSTFEQPDYKF